MTKTLIALTLSTLLAACSSSGTQHAVPTSSAAVGCNGGQVQSDAELARYEGCTEIKGDLVIAGVTTLAPLGDLRRVEGTLSIRETSRLYTLSGLGHLREVGELHLEHNRGLINAGSLNGLTQAQKIVIAKNPRLSRKYGLLGNLSSAAARIDLTENTGLHAEGVASTSGVAVGAL